MAIYRKAEQQLKQFTHQRKVSVVAVMVYIIFG